MRYRYIGVKGLLSGHEWVEKAIKAYYRELVLDNGPLLSPF